MPKVWGRNNSINVQKVMWTIGEIGLDHERIDRGGAFGGLDTEEYLAMNPNGRVPTLRDGHATLWESNVIVRYLAAKYSEGSLWPTDPVARALADQWMDWMVTTLIPDLIPVFWGLVRTSPKDRDAGAIAAGVQGLAASWSILDAHLAGRSHVAGDDLTMGDIPVGAACYRYYELAIERPKLPNVKAWYGRLKEREPFRTHVMIPLS